MRFTLGSVASPPASLRGSPPASSKTTLLPASANRAATVPPPAPEPTTTYSQSAFIGLTRTADGATSCSKNLVSSGFVKRHMVHGMAQAGKRIVHSAAGAALIAERAVL